MQHIPLKVNAAFWGNISFITSGSGMGNKAARKSSKQQAVFFLELFSSSEDGGEILLRNISNSAINSKP
jgi:hypothetical protein